MKKKHAKVMAASLASALVMLTMGAEASIIQFVPSNAGPWDITVNPAYPYGLPSGSPLTGGIGDIHGDPVRVGKVAGLDLVPGYILTIVYESGLAHAGAGIWNDAGGDVQGFLGRGEFPEYFPPAVYVPQEQRPVHLEELLGVFVDRAGVIIGSPFAIGNGPFSAPVPQGAEFFQLGFNDGWYNDNVGGGVYMKLTETSPVPLPAAAFLLAPALGALSFLRRRTA